MAQSKASHSQMARDFRDASGIEWLAVAVDEIVAHGKMGARLAFLRADEVDAPPLTGNVTFNSRAAADFALRTLGNKELLRRLALARAETGTP
jgi:hypothetical protein